MTQLQITSTWQSSEIKVSVICCTYNHENYIRDALNGFLMQKTNFPFEVLVNEDASTDNTARILKEYEEKYPQIIKPIYHDVNEYSKGIDIFGNVAKLAKGKYIAICEGDDYWIDENKLQMQVDFLEGNPEYGMCYTKTKQFVQNKNKFLRKHFGSEIKDFEDLLKNGNRIPTLTTVFRKSLVFKYVEEIKPETKNWLMGDYPMWLYMSHESKVKFFDVATACYRILENSASHSVNPEKIIAFSKSMGAVREFYGNRHDIIFSFYDLNRIYFDGYFNAYRSTFEKNYKKIAISFFKKIENKKNLEKINFMSLFFPKPFFKIFEYMKSLFKEYF